jgi:hypothetical protein
MEEKNKNKKGKSPELSVHASFGLGADNIVHSTCGRGSVKRERGRRTVPSHQKVFTLRSVDAEEYRRGKQKQKEIHV